VNLKHVGIGLSAGSNETKHTAIIWR